MTGRDSPRITKYYAIRIDSLISRNSFVKAVIAANERGFVVGAAFVRGCESPAFHKVLMTGVKADAGKGKVQPGTEEMLLFLGKS